MQARALLLIKPQQPEHRIISLWLPPAEWDCPVEMGNGILCLKQNPGKSPDVRPCSLLFLLILLVPMLGYLGRQTISQVLKVFGVQLF